MEMNELNSNLDAQISDPQQVDNASFGIQVKKLNKRLIVLLSVLSLFSLGIAGSLVHQNYQLKNQILELGLILKEQPTELVQPTITSQSISNISSPTTKIDPTIDWEIYKDVAIGFSIKYPNGWNISPGGGVIRWIDICSQDISLEGSQEPQIGMCVNIRVYDTLREIEENDLRRLVSEEGVLKHFQVNKITEGFVTIQNHNVFKYEYEGIEQSYPFHYWGMNIANDKNLISILLTDYKSDTSLNTKELSELILSTFQFIN